MEINPKNSVFIRSAALITLLIFLLSPICACDKAGPSNISFALRPLALENREVSDIYKLVEKIMIGGQRTPEYAYIFNEHDEIVGLKEARIDGHATEGESGNLRLRIETVVASAVLEKFGILVAVSVRGLPDAYGGKASGIIAVDVSKMNNISVDDDIILLKVLHEYCPEVYRRCFNLARQAAIDEAGRRGASPPSFITNDDLYDFHYARNRIMLGAEGAPGLRALCRSDMQIYTGTDPVSGSGLVRSIGAALYNAKSRRILPEMQDPAIAKQARLQCTWCRENNRNGHTALEAIKLLTLQSVRSAMRVYESLRGATARIVEDPIDPVSTGQNLSMAAI